MIFEHREQAPFDLAEMARQPSLYMADFEELTPAPDTDDWSVKKKSRGKLRTHLDEEELFLVRTRGNATLAVSWGDMPLEQFMRERLAVNPDADGCLSTMESDVRGYDNLHLPVPQRILYCPQASMALFDAPPGYQIGLVALQGEHQLERTEASTTILDNLRLYGRQVYPRSPNSRSTGTLAGNLRASFRDSGQDVLDMGRNLVTGTTRQNIHTGQFEKRTSLLLAVPMLAVGVATLEPLKGGHDLFDGIQSGVQVAADAVSATNNAVVNPLLQTTVGLASLSAANNAGHITGAVSQAWAKNLPGSERMMDSLNPFSLWYHNRAFKPTAYTRTDTQLNIDRLISIANIFGVWALASSGGDGGSDTSATEADPAAAPGSPVPSRRRRAGRVPSRSRRCARAAQSFVGALRHRYAAARVEVVMAVRDSTGVRAAALLAVLIGCGRAEAAAPTDAPPSRRRPPHPSSPQPAKPPARPDLAVPPPRFCRGLVTSKPGVTPGFVLFSPHALRHRVPGRQPGPRRPPVEDRVRAGGQRRDAAERPPPARRAQSRDARIRGRRPAGWSSSTGTAAWCGSGVSPTQSACITTTSPRSRTGTCCSSPGRGSRPNRRASRDAATT